MNVDQLRKYENWIGKSPVAIRKAVIDAGGWAEVFPVMVKGIGPGSPYLGLEASSGFPEWASRVRNFFNVTPVSFERLDVGDGRAGPIKNRRGYNIWLPPMRNRHAFALNGDVYADELGRPWFEMDKVGGVYHTPGEVNARKIYRTFMATYSKMPIFKLISPDDTGGSLEICLFNHRRASAFGEVGEEVPVSPWVVRNELLRGSYNYAETVVRGDLEHEYRDVKAHSERPGFYVNPPHYSPLSDRRFPDVFNPFQFDNTRPDELGVSGTRGMTNPLSDLMALRYPPNHPGSIERVKKLETLFRGTSHPKKLLARIEARKDQAANDFHTTLHPDTVRRLLKILRDRPAE